jgi:outer membrane murein-binding lipoprotein Lpp
MKDERLDHLLRRLPREQAGPQFTERVLAALDAPRRPAGAWRAMPWLAAAVLVAAVAGGGLWLMERARRSELAAQIAELKQQHRQLGAELRALREQVDHRRVIYLGGSEQVDYVLDLGRLMHPAADVRPVGGKHRGESL